MPCLRTLMRYALPALLLPQLACSANFFAVDQFATEQSCPENRLAVQEIRVQPADIFETGQPSPDVAADPQRVAVWRQSIQRNLDRYDQLALVDITGCGTHRAYLCWWEKDADGHSNPQTFPVELDREDAHADVYALKPAARLSLLQRLHATALKTPAP